MRDDYLWDRSGEPDPEVEQLERVLGVLRHADRPPPAATPIAAARRARWRVRLRGVLLLAAALGALAGAAAVWLPAPEVTHAPEARRFVPVIRRAQVMCDAGASEGPIWCGATQPRAALRVERLAGTPTVGAAPLTATAGQLEIGQWLETDASSSARIAVAEIGQVEVAARTRLRLTATGPDQHRLDLERGRIAARVDAPPRLFVVGTPAATAVDLGCVYTLEVDERGAGTLQVASGWVALEDGGRASLVPAGATCLTRPGAGPGTPWFNDAPAALREALARFDFEAGGAAAVGVVLKAARPRDALTLWHLLARVDGALRRSVYDRLRALKPPPADVSEPDVLRLHPPALDRWKEDFAVTW